MHLNSANPQQRTLGLKRGNGLTISKRFGLLSTATSSLRKELSISLIVTFGFLSPAQARCDIWLDYLFADGLQEEQENCPTLPLHAQDVTKSHLKPQLQHRKRWARDEEYLMLPGSWGENPSSRDHACYCWAYAEKRGVRRRRGLCGATRSLHWMQASETNCSGGLASISPDKIWWRNCIPPKEGRWGEIRMYFPNFHKDLTIISS